MFRQKSIYGWKFPKKYRHGLVLDRKSRSSVNEGLSNEPGTERQKPLADRQEAFFVCLWGTERLRLSEIFALRRIWNNVLPPIVKYPASQDVKWNLFFHTPKAYPTAADNFTRVSVFHSFRRNEFHWKSPCISKGFFYGVSSGSRTHDLQGHNLAL